jgi:hypothetical protein
VTVTPQLETVPVEQLIKKPEQIAPATGTPQLQFVPMMMAPGQSPAAMATAPQADTAAASAAAKAQ